MMKMYAIAESKELGEAGKFVAGPTPIISTLCDHIALNEQNVLFVIEEGEEPHYVDLDSLTLVSYKGEVR